MVKDNRRGHTTTAPITLGGAPSAPARRGALTPDRRTSLMSNVSDSLTKRVAVAVIALICTGAGIVSA